MENTKKIILHGNPNAVGDVVDSFMSLHPTPNRYICFSYEWWTFAGDQIIELALRYSKSFNLGFEIEGHICISHIEPASALYPPRAQVSRHNPAPTGGVLTTDYPLRITTFAQILEAETPQK